MKFQANIYQFIHFECFSLYYQYIRIHFLAGIHPNEDWDRQQWEETYVTNLRMAAEECAKVSVHVIHMLSSS